MSRELSYYKSLIPESVEHLPITLKTIDISQIDFVKSLQPRDGTSPTTVEDYADRMRGGVEFHPILLGSLPQRSDFLVIDGHHRLAAFQRLERTLCTALVIGLPDYSYYIRAVLMANTDGKRPLSAADHEIRLTIAHREPSLRTATTRELSKILGGTPSHNAIAEWRRYNIDGLPRPAHKKRGRPPKRDVAAQQDAPAAVAGLPDLSTMGQRRVAPFAPVTGRILRAFAEEDANRGDYQEHRAVVQAVIERLITEGVEATPEALREAALAQLDRAIRVWKLVLSVDHTGSEDGQSEPV